MQLGVLPGLRPATGAIPAISQLQSDSVDANLCTAHRPMPSEGSRGCLSVPRGNDLSIQIGLSRSVRGLRSHVANDGTIGNDTRDQISIAFPRSFDNRDPPSSAAAYEGSGRFDPYNVRAVEREWLTPSFCVTDLKARSEEAL